MRHPDLKRKKCSISTAGINASPTSICGCTFRAGKILSFYVQYGLWPPQPEQPFTVFPPTEFHVSSHLHDSAQVGAFMALCTSGLGCALLPLAGGVHANQLPFFNFTDLAKPNLAAQIIWLDFFCDGEQCVETQIRFNLGCSFNKQTKI